MYDLVVIGGGSAGRSVAAAAARVRARGLRLGREGRRWRSKESGPACWPSKGADPRGPAGATSLLATQHAFGINAADRSADRLSARRWRACGRCRLALANRGSRPLDAQGASWRRDPSGLWPAFSAYDTVQSGRRAAAQVSGSSSRPALARLPPEITGSGRGPGYLDTDSIWSLAALRRRALTVITTRAGRARVLLSRFARLGIEGHRALHGSGLDSFRTTIRRPRRSRREAPDGRRT